MLSPIGFTPQPTQQRKPQPKPAFQGRITQHAPPTAKPTPKFGAGNEDTTELSPQNKAALQNFFKALFKQLEKQGNLLAQYGLNDFAEQKIQAQVNRISTIFPEYKGPTPQITHPENPINIEDLSPEEKNKTLLKLHKQDNQTAKNIIRELDKAIQKTDQTDSGRKLKQMFATDKAQLTHQMELERITLSALLGQDIPADKPTQPKQPDNKAAGPSRWEKVKSGWNNLVGYIQFNATPDNSKIQAQAANKNGQSKPAEASNTNGVAEASEAQDAQDTNDIPQNSEADANTTNQNPADDKKDSVLHGWKKTKAGVGAGLIAAGIALKMTVIGIIPGLLIMGTGAALMGWAGLNWMFSGKKADKQAEGTNNNVNQENQANESAPTGQPAS